MHRRFALLLFLATTAAVVALAPGPRAATPLPAGHYAGPATATWSVTSSPRWLVGLALKAIEVREGVDDIPASGSCTGVVGLNVPGGGAAFTGAARCEFAGGLAKYNNRVASLAGQEFGTGVRGTATCCGTGEEIRWSARRDADNVVTGEAAGSNTATAISVKTWLGDVEVSLRVDWTVAFVATRVD
jgi:hypothetical protein